MIPFKIQQRGPGDIFGRVDASFINRTGATMVRGQVAMMDLLDTQAEVEAGNFEEGNSLSVFAGLTPCTQAAVENGFPVVVALESVGDNQTGRFCCAGKVEVAVLDDDVSTTDIDKGDPISILVSESAVAVQAFANGDRFLGIALEDAAADSANTDRLIDASSHLRWCLWCGGAISCNLDA